MHLSPESSQSPKFFCLHGTDEEMEAWRDLSMVTQTLREKVVFSPGRSESKDLFAKS